ncbi:MAG: hypothetical protein J6W56_04640 [Prevotella sp.]|nr:hypothetical protein [Prevotella sp.]
MKKVLFGLMAIMIGLFSSCSNDEINVNVVPTPEPPRTLSLSISTTPGFEPFGIDYYKNQLLNNNQPYYIGVKTYLYDDSGIIVDSVNSYTKTFNQVDQTFANLKRGSYTAVTVETLVNSDYQYTSDYWDIIGASQLNTLAIKMNSTSFVVYWGGVIAVASKVITIASEDEAVSLSPSPMGALVDVHYLDFNKSSYTLAALYSKNKPIGMSLNPNVRDSERYLYDEYLETHTWDRRDYEYSSTGFTEGDYSHTVYLIEQGDLNWCFGAQTPEDDGRFTAYPNSSSHFTLENGKYYYAGFCYKGGTKGSDCEAAFCKTLAELQEWYNSIDKSNQDQDLLFKEPYLVWGGTVSAVQTHMSSYSPGNSAPEASGDFYLLWYYGKYKEIETDYYFTSSTGGLAWVNMFFESSVGEDEIMSELTNNGYTLAEYDSSEETYYYLSSDQKTVARFLKNSEGYWLVQYYGYSSSARARGDAMDKTSKITGKAKSYEVSSPFYVVKNNRISLRQLKK